jgi:predicted hotdog family 3-hydroxylacyl-ACP dehydratase
MTTNTSRIPDRAIAIPEIEKYLPHRPPMVWIDEVLHFSEKAGQCRLRIRAEGLYMDAEGLRPTSCLEFIAQSYGFISVCHHIYILDPNSKPLSKAFLASIKGAELPATEVLRSIKPGDAITITVDGVRQMGPIVLFNGRVHRGEELLCEAQMKVFKEYQQ